MKFQRDADDYLTMYPRALKWINQCIVCQRKGFRPDMPRDEWPNLVRYFDPLHLGPDGRCDQCGDKG
jgi:hypothetical protein